MEVANNSSFEGQANGVTTMVCVTRDLQHVLKSALTKPQKMTGMYKLCMLIDGVVKRYRYPTAVVELKTPYYTGTAKVLCMESPVEDIIIGNIPGALGAEIQPNTCLLYTSDAADE